MSEIDRREFLKLVGVGAGAVAASGCSDLPEKLIPYVIQPEEILPGLPVVYASTCQECSAACGLHVRTRESRPVKLEGNPQHPINQGALCARGQASIGRTYHPDRYRGPLRRGADGALAPITWDDAQKELAGRIAAAQGKLALLGAPTGPSLSRLIDAWLAAVGGGSRVVYEPFAEEALREACSAVFGVASTPIFDLEGCDLVIDFGGDAIGTGHSRVEHARQLMAARDVANEKGRAARLVYVGPRLDETASVADEWIPAKPGSEGLFALALARAVADTRGAAAGDESALLGGVLASFSPEAVAERVGVSADVIRRLGAQVAAASRPVALPPGVALSSRRAVATNSAVLLLDAVAGARGGALRIPPPAETKAASFRDAVKLVDAMKSGEVKLLLVHGGANPVHTLPPDAGFAAALEQVEMVVSFASAPDETSARAHLVLPDHTPLESWGDAAPRPGVRSLVQPVFRPLFDTQSFGDTLLGVARAMGESVTAQLPSGSFRGVVEAAWSDTDWRGAVARGGVFGDGAWAGAPALSPGLARIEWREPQLEGDGEFTLLPVPSPLLGDGSGANLPWLQETPDPITKVTWQSWAEISESKAAALGVRPGDVLKLETPYGSLEVPAWPRGGIRDDVVALAVGQGHTVGRYASREIDGQPGVARGVNVISLLPAQTDEAGGRAWLATRAHVTKADRFQRLPFTQGEDNKRGRLLGEAIPLSLLAQGGPSPWAANEAAARFDHGTPPEPVAQTAAATAGAAAAGHAGEAGAEGHAAEEHGGSGHGNVHHGPHEMRRAFDLAADSMPEDPFRWVMTIDVDRCTGCSACVVACSVENNIPIVGEAQVMRARQMSWLRIERFIGDGEPTLQAGRPGPQNTEQLGVTDVRNSPMLCQQCGAAPCEPVCPVLATYHTASGLNGMIYNRCIGTRYCSNNCPYKVRRFNWFDYQIETWPDPMPLMLNPDVTVRAQGVMEKCTFCVQRIQAGRLHAKGEGRATPADGEVKTACQQTCPTGAIHFGNWKDGKSDVRQAAVQGAGRAYHALHVLNTRPAITYLARVRREEPHSG